MIHVKPKDASDFNERIKLAMHEMGVGVSKGAWTTFLGCVILVFSQSAAFRTFFYMFSGVIIIALAHGILLVPALLGEVSCFFIDTKNTDTSAVKKVDEKPKAVQMTSNESVGNEYFD